MAVHKTEGFWLRLAATVYYGIVCSFSVHRFFGVLLGDQLRYRLTSAQIAVFVFLIFTSWCLVSILNNLNDRLAAVLYGIFYITRISANFANGPYVAVLTGLGCAIILSGMATLILGIIRQSAHKERSKNPRNGSL